MSIVLKIGGSSLLGAESLKRMHQLVQQYEEPVILVVSAFNGLTDRLYQIIREEGLDDSKIEAFLKQTRQGFEDVLYATITDTDLQFSTIKLFH